MKQVAKPTPNAKESQQGGTSAVLEAGDIAPSCVLPSLDDTIVDIRADAIAGNPLVLLFCPNFSELTRTSLKALVAARPSFIAAGAQVFVVTLGDADNAQKQHIPFPVLLDDRHTRISRPGCNAC